MSKISLKPNSSGTGVFSLEAPNSNVDRTLNLPDEAGTVLTNVSDIETQVKTATNATGSAPVYACRAWVNFAGAVGSIRASGNVSSITDNGAGDYSVNFTTAMPDANYSAVVTVGKQGDPSGTATPVGSLRDNSTAPTTTSVRIGTEQSTNAAVIDALRVNAAIFR